LEEEDFRNFAVEDWLSPLKKPNGKALAPGTKKKIRDLMHVLYAHAIRYEWIDHNPTRPFARVDSVCRLRAVLASISYSSSFSKY
jgi:hypothetical protein